MGKVNDNNEIVLDKRLMPKNTQRIIKIPNKILDAMTNPKTILGKTKDGTIIRTRKNIFKKIKNKNYLKK